MQLVADEQRGMIQAQQIELLESHMLELPQVECPVAHHFGPGTYIREVTLPAGAIAVGHAQRFEQLNIMLTGKVAILDDQGQVKLLEAPMIFVGPPGRKVGYVIETCTWLNVYSTDERDIDKLEATFLDKSETWQKHAESSAPDHQADRDDFISLIAEAGFTEEKVREQSENTDDQISVHHSTMPKVTIRNSSIEGKGVFLSSPAETNELLAPARIGGMRTPVGRYTNHSKSPNAKFIMSDTGDIYLVALKPIAGCHGGGQGEEVTIDYRQALSLSGIHLPKGEPQ